MKTRTILKIMDMPIPLTEERMDMEASALVQTRSDFADISRVSLDYLL